MAQVKKKKIDKNKDLNYLIAQRKDDFYIQALLRESDIAKPVSDDEVKKIYDEKVKDHKVKEFKISHILMKSEQAAKDIIAELDGLRHLRRRGSRTWLAEQRTIKQDAQFRPGRL